ncbi:DNA-packaging protein [Escherichia coli]|uniref:DNA-packaging protein FI n=1 Tax=Escherichia coli TaxID=562 RepID=UPI000BE4146E|nr:DNA-packaging protein FI [Escherichia coli]EFM2070053.1 DNA-packaging protein [Escherichia coli]EJL1875878.1 DNA-packaging protein [Escherichia coli]ELK1277635.1 DNA-packaging protein [Escherichia coli]EMB3656236.1 DNA-packaging protein [Escherichia coli]HCN5968446.1 DNA-packaging protein [Escherichia coli]
MSTKTELLARIDDLSAQLGRELPRSGTIAELESIVAGAESELDILNEQSGDASDADTNESTSDETDDNGVEQQSIASTTSQPELSPATRRVKLRNTLDVYHYVNGRRVREIVAAGREIVVDSPEVADLIAADHVYAL